MTENRIQFNNIVQNQLPEYVREEFPLVAEFLKQYYISQEFQGSSVDLIQNIDSYLKLDTIKSNSDSTELCQNVSLIDKEIFVSSTNGFPNSYGLIQIDNEIITYTGTKQNLISGSCSISVGSNIVYVSGISTEYKDRPFNIFGVKEIPTIVSVENDYIILSESAIESDNTPGYSEDGTYEFTVDRPQFIGCIRGFSGVTSYNTENTSDKLKFKSPDSTELEFKSDEASQHYAYVDNNEANAKTQVINLSSLFLKEFFNKIKYQITPGFENREFYSGLDKYLFLKQSKDFYSTRGTDLSFKILFKVLYGEEVKIIKPQDYLIKPSNSQYEITDDLVVESISGDPYELERSTLNQDEYINITKAYAPISRVEKIFSENDKVYYRLSFDAGYNKDISVSGSVYGNFSVHPKTKVIGNIQQNSNSIDVDSTIGFPLFGELYVIYSDGSEGIITYSSKNINQFLDCTDIFGTISDSSEISLNTYAYGYSSKNPDQIIKVRINSVLNNVDILEDTYYQQRDTIGIIRTLGIGATDISSKNWFFNVSTSFIVENVQQLSTASDIYNISTKDSHNLKIGDSIKIISDSQDELYSTVIGINSSTSLKVSGQGYIDPDNFYTIKRNLLKVNSEKYSSLSNQLCNVQNVYKDKEKTLIASNSLPFYYNQPLNTFDRSITFSGFITASEDFGGDIITITSSQDHGFYTGESIYYTNIQGPLIDEGLYFIKRIDGKNIMLSKSRSNLYSELFVTFEDSDTNNIQGKIQDYNFYNKSLKPQKLLREINPPINDGSEYISSPGPVGILVNGVEIFNYKSRDQLYYGPIESIDVVNPGKNYDVINPPILTILDSVGVGATGYCSVKGSLKEIRIIDPGFDYLETPKINISGGNGYDAKANASMKLIDHKVLFNAEAKSASVDIINNTIGFSTYHKFRNAEKIIYKTNSQTSVGGISSNSTYYVSLTDLYTIKLHKTFDDALSGINTISLTSYGIGNHIIESYNKKLVLSSINVESSGSDYENKKRTTNSSGINTSLGYINIDDHDFNSGEIVKYSTTGTAIGGLVNNNNYYITKVDQNNFKLSLVGVGTDNQDFYYRTNQYLQITSKGSGFHTFNYPEISVEVIGKIGVSTETYLNTNISNIVSAGSTIIYVSNKSGVLPGSLITISGTEIKNKSIVSIGNSFVRISSSSTINSSIGAGTTVSFINFPGINLNAQVQPVFSGEITSVHLQDHGVGYGSSEIFNFIRDPLLTLSSGENAQLTPILNNGSIVDVLVNNPGQNYNSPPYLRLSTNGSGFGAVLTPIIENGQIKSVKIIEGGSGYDKNNISILVLPSGSGCQLSSKLNSWTVNLFAKSFKNISQDDGIITYNPTSKYNLQYSHIYAPRKLRETLYSEQSSKKVYYDLVKKNNIEVSSSIHSPIIGWAYDGNPIYGPYGYKNTDGTGGIVQLISGYYIKSVADLLENRPPLNIFPQGFFVEDYEHRNTNENSILDEYNGRFCITPEFPNGTYAYFSTFDKNSSNSFNGYKIPAFPYIIGNKYRSRPNEFNFNRSSNQDDINLNDTRWVRNTIPYNLDKNYNSYPYISLPNLLNQTVNIKYASSGSIENVGIITGGDLYKVNDNIIFDDNRTGGFGFASKVSRILGKPVNTISVASTFLYNVQIYPSPLSKNSFIVESESPHNFNDDDIISISGLNTTTSSFNLPYTINVSQNTFSVSDPLGVDSISVTGIATYIPVSGDFANQNIKENDIYLINNEKIKILSIDKNSSRIRVLRSFGGTVGASHSYGDILYEIPRRFSISENNSGTFVDKINKEIYFNPKESLGIGTVYGVGIGVTLYFTNPGTGATQIFIPTKSIYIPNHKLQTGDQLTYFSNSGSEISVSADGNVSSILPDQSTVYVAKISEDLIGISTVKVGLGTNGTFVGIASTNRTSGTLYFIGVGTNTYHSFKTNYSDLTGKVSKNIVTVSTSQTHGLLNNDYVYVNVNSGISTTYVIRYNDYNKKLVVNPKSFLSGDVNVTDNSITLINHGFINGQKVIYTSTSPSGGLQNNKIYYIVVFDENTIKLSISYYSSISELPEIVNITSSSSGTLSSINPPIKCYRNSTLVFDVSDESLSYSISGQKYSAFDLNFYTDYNFTQVFNSSGSSNTFEVSKFGKVGIDTLARVSLKINENIPPKLFYNLDVLYGESLPSNKKEYINDPSVDSNNQIQIEQSIYNGKHKITDTSFSSFSYNLPQKPEVNLYNSSNSILSYETTSLNAYGPISKIEINSKGQNYYTLPKFITVKSEFGSNAILEAISTSIGKIQKTKINDIGFNFSSDYTLKPCLSLPQILKIEPLNSFESIKVTSVGRGYTSPPKLIVFDGRTKQPLPEVDLKYSLGDTYVTILNNTYRLSDIDPIILPIQNSNGVPIDTINYNSTTKDVTIILSVGFSTENSFPFDVNDRILVENVSVGISSIGKGFNSENYNYQLFTITSVDENLGGLYGSITYNLGEFLSQGEFPGNYDAENSSGRVIPEKYFPQFKSTITANNFFKNEQLKYGGEDYIIGTVQDWNENIKYLTVSSKEVLIKGQILEGVSSKTQGLIFSSFDFDAFINLNSYSKVERGWASETGILNNNLQRLQDNFYYQNFSYSLKSKVAYDTWENVVSSLNHTAGFRKFSDYQLESYQSCGISTDVKSSVDVTVDIDGFASLNCVYDFDLASENSLIIGSSIISDEITFSSRIITDYFESIGNRVLLIDDISPFFNSNSRAEKYSVVHRFPLTDARAQKYITYVRDRRYTSQRQMMILTLLHDGSIGYLSQYARVESVNDLGSFDFRIEDTDGTILFYPTKYKVNDYDVTTLSYNLKDNFTGIGSTTIGGIVEINTGTNFVSSGSTTIVGVGSTYTSLKVLVEIAADNGRYQFDEINIVHDGTDIEFLDYGQLDTQSMTSYSSTEIGTYNAYLTDSNLNIDFTPNVGIAASISTIQVAIANTFASGIGTFDMKYVKFEAKSTSIASTTSPSAKVISEYSNPYGGGYFIIQVSDINNNRHQMSEVVVLNNNNDVYFTEFGNINTYSGLGTVGVAKTTSSTKLLFTPISNINVQVKVYSNTLSNYDVTNSITEYNDNTFTSDYQVYYGTEKDLKRSFELKHKGYPIFRKYFDASDSNIVSIGSSTIKIVNHFLTTGEKVTYSTGDIYGTSSPIGIASTYFGVGIGTTDKLPAEVYVIKIDENTIKLARSAEDALKEVPKSLNITSVGIGSSHLLISTKQNLKALISIDNVIQSPIVSTSSTTKLSSDFLIEDDVLYSDDVTNFFIGDLLKIDDEIVKVEYIGVGETNAVRVMRPWMGTEVEDHTYQSVITKLVGNYNIVDNVLNFVDAPYGNVPLGTSTNPPDEKDWAGISTNSTFHGRTFMRSGISEGINESYYKNNIFDDISHSFDGITKTFNLKQNELNIENISQENAVILINDIFQGPGLNSNYTLSESGGVISVNFVGSATSIASDINTSDFPSGGIIVSVGSTEGFGYQPLVCAGGTSIVSSAGTISAISIGNSGSGYRSYIESISGINTVVVRVGVATSSVVTNNIEYIGIASVLNGNIVSIAVTNPGIGYTRSNPPHVFIDNPISYSDIPLIYSTSSPSIGVGTETTIDIVVGQGSSVISFEIKNFGYGYKNGDILTLPTTGITGIPTVRNSEFREFQISVQETFTDKFSGWSIGEIQPLDKIENLFNGKRVIFPLLYLGDSVSIYAKKGSPIDIQYNLLVFINDILQIPGESYIFNGGSKITFTEAPELEDTCKILFYKGSGEGVDVIFRNIIETVKMGDDLTLTYDSFIGQSSTLLEDPRYVTDILSLDTVETNPYFGPGNTSDETIKRPIVWCRQTEDKIINEIAVSKSRLLYEPMITPLSYLISPVGVGSTVIFVDNIRPFFNQLNENNVSLDFQKNITLISQDTKVSASATATVSTAGTVSRINISNGGKGYDIAPIVSIQSPVGIGTTITTIATSYITSGIVTSIIISKSASGYSRSNPPQVLIEPPSIQKEKNVVLSYEGDFGFISGVSTTSVGIASTALVFDFVIPNNSYLRNAVITGVTTISGIQTGYYFTISNSNVGYGLTALNSSGSVIGIGRSFIDGVYQVSSVSIAMTSVIGYGLTYVARVTTSVSSFNGLSGLGYSGYYGNYSWGRIMLKYRSKETSYNSYTSDGYSGISTGTIVCRSTPLKYLNYIS